MNSWHLSLLGIGIDLCFLAACLLLASQPAWLAGVGPAWLAPLAAAAAWVHWRQWEFARAIAPADKAAKQALGRSQEQLHQIISTLPIPLFIKDPQSCLVMMNSACEQQWGVRFDQVEGTKAAEFFPPEQMKQFLADDQAVFSHGQLLVVEEMAWNAARGENRLLETRKKPVFDSDGKPAYLIGVSLDITERKQAQDRLQHSLRQLRQLSEHVQATTEEERRQVASGIHDELGQNLLALKIDIAMLEQRTAGQHPRLHHRVRAALGTLDTTIESVRSIINSLRPAVLDLGIDAALEWQLNQFRQRSGVACSLDVQANLVPLDSHLTAAVYRIVDESLDNVARHAKAGKVAVALAVTPEWLSLSIVDDGVGMHEEGEKTGFGLREIRERVDAFGGELQIDSAHGGGTALSIQIPQPMTASKIMDQKSHS